MYALDTQTKAKASAEVCQAQAEYVEPGPQQRPADPDTHTHTVSLTYAPLPRLQRAAAEVPKQPTGAATSGLDAMESLLEMLQAAGAAEQVEHGASNSAAAAAAAAGSATPASALSAWTEAQAERAAAMAKPAPFAGTCAVQGGVKLRVAPGEMLRIAWSTDLDSLPAQCAAARVLQRPGPAERGTGALAWDRDADPSPSDMDWVGLLQVPDPHAEPGSSPDIRRLDSRLHVRLEWSTAPDDSTWTAWLAEEADARQQRARAAQLHEHVQGVLRLAAPHKLGRYVAAYVHRWGAVIAASRVFEVADAPTPVATTELPPVQLPSPGADGNAIAAQRQAAVQQAWQARLTAVAEAQRLTSASMTSIGAFSAASGSTVVSLSRTAARALVTAWGLAGSADTIPPAALRALRARRFFRPPFALEYLGRVHVWTAAVPIPVDLARGLPSSWAPALHVQEQVRACVAFWLPAKGKREQYLLEFDAPDGLASSGHSWSICHSPRGGLSVLMARFPAKLAAAPRSETPATAAARRTPPQEVAGLQTSNITCKWCGAELAPAGQFRVHRLPSQHWVEWLEHWLCRTEERQALLPRYSLNPKPSQRALGPSAVLLHPRDATGSALVLAPTGEHDGLAEVDDDWRQVQRWAKAAALPSSGDASNVPAAQEVVVRCARCRTRVGRSVACVAPSQHASLAQAFPRCFDEATNTDGIPTPLLSLHKSAVSACIDKKWDPCALPLTAPAWQHVLAAAHVEQAQVHERSDVFAEHSAMSDIGWRVLVACQGTGAWAAQLLPSEAAAHTCACVQLRCRGWGSAVRAAGAALCFEIDESGMLARPDLHAAPGVLSEVMSSGLSSAATAGNALHGLDIEAACSMSVTWRTCAEPGEASSCGPVLRVPHQLLQQLHEMLACTSTLTPQVGVPAGWQLAKLPL